MKRFNSSKRLIYCPSISFTRVHIVLSDSSEFLAHVQNLPPSFDRMQSALELSLRSFPPIRQQSSRIYLDWPKSLKKRCGAHWKNDLLNEPKLSIDKENLSRNQLKTYRLIVVPNWSCPVKSVVSEKTRTPTFWTNFAACASMWSWLSWEFLSAMNWNATFTQSDIIIPNLLYNESIIALSSFPITLK